MTKSEADQLVLAGKKFGIRVSIKNIGGEYEVWFLDKVYFKSFEAAKLVMNALVIENRLKKKVQEDLPHPDPGKPLDFSRHSKPRREKGSSNWGERRSRND